MFNFIKILALFSLLSITINVNATTIHAGSIGTLGPVADTADPDVLFFNQKLESGIVDDIFLFNIDTGGLPSAAAASITSISMTSLFSSFGPVKILEVTDFQFALTDKNGLALTTFVGTGESLSLDPVQTGTFGIWLKGDATGLAGGAVSGPIALTSVPIPAAVWLFGSALITLSVLRRT